MSHWKYNSPVTKSESKDDCCCSLLPTAKCEIYWSLHQSALVRAWYCRVCHQNHWDGLLSPTQSSISFVSFSSFPLTLDPSAGSLKREWIWMKEVKCEEVELRRSRGGANWWIIRVHTLVHCLGWVGSGEWMQELFVDYTPTRQGNAGLRRHRREHWSS